MAGAAVLASAYVAASVALARSDQLWNDELFTFHIARLPGMGDVWDVLADGTEQIPPGFYALTRASLWALGDGSVALRLPAIAGVLLGAICVGTFVARRTTALHGLGAALALLGTQATVYAHEARPYGLVLGLSAAALLAWQVRGERARSTWPVVALSASLALAIACHYVAVLALVPLLLGEVVRTRFRGSVDRAVLIGFALALTPLLAFASLIRAGSSFSGSFWTTFGWADALGFTGWVVRTSAVPPALGRTELAVVVWALVAVSLIVLFAPTALRARLGLVRATPEALADSAAAAGFLLVPLAAVGAAILVTGAYTPRYVLFAAIGVVSLPALALARLDADRRWPIALVALVLVAVVGRVFWYQRLEVRADNEERERRLALVSGEVGSQPGVVVVLSDPHDFLELSHLAPDAVRRRLVRPTSPALALRYIDTDSTEAGLETLGRIAPLEVEDYDAFVRRERSFVLFLTSDPDRPSWIDRALRDGGRTFATRGATDLGTFYEIR